MKRPAMSISSVRHYPVATLKSKVVKVLQIVAAVDDFSQESARSYGLALPSYISLEVPRDCTVSHLKDVTTRIIKEKHNIPVEDVLFTLLDSRDLKKLQGMVSHEHIGKYRLTSRMPIYKHRRLEIHLVFCSDSD